MRNPAEAALALILVEGFGLPLGFRKRRPELGAAQPPFTDLVTAALPPEVRLTDVCADAVRKWVAGYECYVKVSLSFCSRSIASLIR